jgi:predicted SnoaL-like aldol condensation-catalyzing enzyme
MRRLTATVSLLPALFAALLLQTSCAFAAGAVEMQVERHVLMAIDDYNSAMEAGSPEDWLKYFTDNVRRTGPLGSQQGRAAFNQYYQDEFKNLKARWTVKKTMATGRSVAAVVQCDLTRRATGAQGTLDMAIVFELAASGRFESIDFYFDTAKLAELDAD